MSAIEEQAEWYDPRPYACTRCGERVADNEYALVLAGTGTMLCKSCWDDVRERAREEEQ